MSIGAFFDIDGTLLPKPSLERRFAAHLRYCGLLGPRQRLAWLAGLPRVWKQRLPLGANKHYLSAIPSCLVEAQVSRFLKIHNISRLLDQFMMERVRAHQRAGHRVFLISGSLHLLVCRLGEEIGIDAACGTRVQVLGGSFSGELLGPHVYGPAKVEQLRQLSGIWRIDLAKSFAYANEVADLSFLTAVGHPFAVEPDSALLEHAEKAGWPVLHLADAAGRTKIPAEPVHTTGEAA